MIANVEDDLIYDSLALGRASWSLNTYLGKGLFIILGYLYKFNNPLVEEDS